MNLETVGNLLLGMASIAAVASIVSIAAGGRDGADARKLGSILSFSVLGFTTLAIAMITVAFLTENFVFEYVINNHPTITGPWAWLYRISGVWAGREGSLLFWEWVLAIFAAFIAGKLLKRDDRVGSAGLAVINFVQLFFLAALFIEQNNPFHLAPPGIVDPQTGALLTSAAMNPLLQTWAMIAHPPTLFIGYAGLTVPFAFALAALIVGDTSSHWVKFSDRITVFSWLLLGIGIGLGAVWAYIELAFGGYWAWDPVENASILPWLTGVGLIHSMTVYRRRNGFRAWTMMMAAVTFVFVLLGTFITRSGVVQSVHAFEQDPLSFWLFLTMMVGSLVAMGVGVYRRRAELASESDGFEHLFSKEGSYYFNNVIMLISAVLVAYLTLAPALPSWLPGGGNTFKPPAYDALARPLGIFYILVMTACPVLAWGGGDWKKLWERSKMPIILGTALSAVFLALFFTAFMPYYTADGSTPVWWHHFVAVLGVVTAGYAVALPIWLFIDGASKRAAATQTSFGSALGWVFTRARTQSGGYLTHLGMGIILLGLVGSTMFVRTHQVSLPQQAGASYEAEGYTFTYTALDQTEENVTASGQGDVVYTLRMGLSKAGRPLGEVGPQIRFPQQLRQQNSTTQHVALHSELLKDVFISFGGVDESNNANLTIKFFPMQSWVWAGFVITIVGSALAAWPKKTKLAA